MKLWELFKKKTFAKLEQNLISFWLWVEKWTSPTLLTNFILITQGYPKESKPCRTKLSVEDLCVNHKCIGIIVLNLPFIYVCPFYAQRKCGTHYEMHKLCKSVLRCSWGLTWSQEIEHFACRPDCSFLRAGITLKPMLV